MSVTTTIDIGTAIVPLPFTDPALCYSVAYEDGGQSATITVRQYSESDSIKGHTPKDVYSEQVRKEPGIWIMTYSNMDGEFNILQPVKEGEEFYTLTLKYDDRVYAWRLDKDKEHDFLTALSMGREPVMPESMIRQVVDRTKNKNK